MIRFVAPLILLAALAFPASAKTAKDCEKIANPMEYNLCLASLSPVRGSPEARRRSRRPPEGVEQVSRRGGAGRRTAQVQRVKLPEGALKMVNGRVRLEIAPR